MATTMLDDLQYLDLAEILEPEQNSLRVIVLEAKVMTGLTAASMVPPIAGALPVLHSTGCRVFEVEWDSYIAYSVRNESYAQNSKGEQFEGRHLRVYSTSRYLEFVADATIASKVAPGPFHHWALFCLNHVVDVVSVSEPTIRARAAA